MSKGKLNSFLPGYFAALGIGTLGLGYLAWSASSAATEAKASYEAKRATLESMQRGSIFPNEQNEAKKKQLVDALAAKVKTLVDGVSSYQSPINAAETGESFQKKLVAATAAITEAAKERKVTLGEKFDIGFDKYSDSFASTEAAPKLAAQLDAVTYLLNTAMASGVTSLESFKRIPLEVESAKADATPAAAPGKPGVQPKPAAKPAPGTPASRAAATKAPAGPAVEESKVLERQPMQLTVTGSNIAITQFLSTLANVKPGEAGVHFFTIRTLKVENAMKDGPDKAVTVIMEEKEDPETKTTVKRDAKYILGNESVTLYLDVDLIRFLDPSAEATPAATPAK
ncbi:MAG: hypothetical protein RLZZ179_1079 [Verrucomicrobiota bacterium]|jgi:hypothetical protein